MDAAEEGAAEEIEVAAGIEAEAAAEAEVGTGTPSAATRKKLGSPSATVVASSATSAGSALTVVRTSASIAR